MAYFLLQTDPGGGILCPSRVGHGVSVAGDICPPLSWQATGRGVGHLRPDQTRAPRGSLERSQRVRPAPAGEGRVSSSSCVPAGPTAGPCHTVSSEGRQLRPAPPGRAAVATVTGQTRWGPHCTLSSDCPVVGHNRRLKATSAGPPVRQGDGEPAHLACPPGGMRFDSCACFSREEPVTSGVPNLSTCPEGVI